MKKTKEKIDEIANIVAIEGLSMPAYNLMSGTSGIVLFLSEYADITQNVKYEDVAGEILERTIDLVYKHEPIFPYAGGLAGVGFLFSWLEEKRDLSDIITKEIDDYLTIGAVKEMEKSHYDFLHGLMGIAYYFIHRAKITKTIAPILYNVVDYLQETARYNTEKNELKWRKLKDDGIIEYNTSLSHGMASIIALLSKLYLLHDANLSEKVKPLIIGSVNYILNQEIDRNIYGSYYSYLAIESENSIRGSRLAWCYGDLGIATTLYQAGVALGQQNWINKSIEILTFAAMNRRDLGKNMVMDAGLCHGTSGIGHIFYRMWWSTKLPEFKDAADYWFAETLKMAKFEDGLAGYKTWQGEQYGGWLNQCGLLEGIAGIGLALLSYSTETEPSWDESLLLS